MNEHEAAQQCVTESFVRSLCFDPGDEAAERETLKMRYRRELRAIKQKHKQIKKKGSKTNDNCK